MKNNFITVIKDSVEGYLEAITAADVKKSKASTAFAKAVLADGADAGSIARALFDYVAEKGDSPEENKLYAILVTNEIWESDITDHVEAQAQQLLKDTQSIDVLTASTKDLGNHLLLAQDLVRYYNAAKPKASSTQAKVSEIYAHLQAVCERNATTQMDTFDGQLHVLVTGAANKDHPLMSSLADLGERTTPRIYNSMLLARLLGHLASAGPQEKFDHYTRVKNLVLHEADRTFAIIDTHLVYKTISRLRKQEINIKLLAELGFICQSFGLPGAMIADIFSKTPKEKHTYKKFKAAVKKIENQNAPEYPDFRDITDGKLKIADEKQQKKERDRQKNKMIVEGIQDAIANKIDLKILGFSSAEIEWINAAIVSGTNLSTLDFSALDDLDKHFDVEQSETVRQKDRADKNQKFVDAIVAGCDDYTANRNGYVTKHLTSESPGSEGLLEAAKAVKDWRVGLIKKPITTDDGQVIEGDASASQAGSQDGDDEDVVVVDLNPEQINAKLIVEHKLLLEFFKYAMSEGVYNAPKLDHLHKLIDGKLKKGQLDYIVSSLKENGKDNFYALVIGQLGETFAADGRIFNLRAFVIQLIAMGDLFPQLRARSLLGDSKLMISNPDREPGVAKEYALNLEDVGNKFLLKHILPFYGFHYSALSSSVISLLPSLFNEMPLKDSDSAKNLMLAAHRDIKAIPKTNDRDPRSITQVNIETLVRDLAAYTYSENGKPTAKIPESRLLLMLLKLGQYNLENSASALYAADFNRKFRMILSDLIKNNDVKAYLKNYQPLFDVVIFSKITGKFSTGEHAREAKQFLETLCSAFSLANDHPAIGALQKASIIKPPPQAVRRDLPAHTGQAAYSFAYEPASHDWHYADMSGGSAMMYAGEYLANWVKDLFEGGNDDSSDDEPTMESLGGQAEHMPVAQLGRGGTSIGFIAPAKPVATTTTASAAQEVERSRPAVARPILNSNPWWHASHSAQKDAPGMNLESKQACPKQLKWIARGHVKMGLGNEKSTFVNDDIESGIEIRDGDKIITETDFKQQECDVQLVEMKGGVAAHHQTNTSSVNKASDDENNVSDMEARWNGLRKN